MEHATVHGNSYGTLKDDIIVLLQQGRNVVMDIDAVAKRDAEEV